MSESFWHSEVTGFTVSGMKWTAVSQTGRMFHPGVMLHSYTGGNPWMRLYLFAWGFSFRPTFLCCFSQAGSSSRSLSQSSSWIMYSSVVTVYEVLYCTCVSIAVIFKGLPISPYKPLYFFFKENKLLNLSVSSEWVSVYRDWHRGGKGQTPLYPELLEWRCGTPSVQCSCPGQEHHTWPIPNK